MKKFLLIIPVLVVLLVGCGEKSGTITCTLKSNDVVNEYSLDSTYKINYTNNLVDSVETLEIVTSDNKDVLDYFKETIENTYSKTNEAYGGYVYEITQEEGKVTSNVIIDYTKMDLDKFVEDQPSLNSYTKNGKLKVDGIIELYESMGAICE